MSMKLPSMLSFERKLETSDALMSSGVWESVSNETSQWSPIAITKRQNRSTQSAYGISDDNKTKPNPVSSDSDDANLPYDHDTLKVSFTLRVIGNLGAPFGCNEPNFEKTINEKVNEYKEDGLKELASRYAQNIANGRFLWRNRVGASEISIHVRTNKEKQTLCFDSYDFSLNQFDSNKDNDALVKLSGAIFDGLASENDFVCIEVDAFVKLGNGQHVFPSQEMNMKEKSKVLFKLNDCAALHSVKVGNALRTIDDWYENAEFPIAIEPFGAVTQRGQAYRKSKIDLYTLMLNWVNNKEVSPEQKNYVLGNIIRGGVFGGKSE